MANSEFPHPFGELEETFKRMFRELPIKASNIAVNEFKENFRRQGYEGESGTVTWKPRTTIKNDRDKSRSILIKSGRMRRATRPAPLSEVARVVNDTPYAQIHNEGGEIKGTFDIRAFRRKNGQKVRAHTRRVNTTIEARPFMITTPKLMRDIELMVFAELDKLF